MERGVIPSVERGIWVGALRLNNDCERELTARGHRPDPSLDARDDTLYDADDTGPHFLNMFVGVALFELHIPHAQSLKEKRMVVKSLRDKIRNRFEVSVAEVTMQDLHQRARLAASVVSGDGPSIEKVLSSIERFVESNEEAALVGWTQEVMDFDSNSSLEIPNTSGTANEL